MMKIALLGNCQVSVIGEVLAQLRPNDDVETFLLGRLDERSLHHTITRLPNFDRVFAHYIHDKSTPAYGANLRQQVSRIEFIPMLNFTGLHPDYLAVHGLTSPLGLGVGHSRLVIAGWLAGLSPERAARLFNSFVYAHLGYFDHYERAKVLLLRAARGVGYDLSALLPQFEAMGRWLYVPHHPTAAALAVLAKHIAEKSGLCQSVDDLNSPPAKDMLGAMGQIWPIYPEIADRLGLDGGDMMFRLGAKSGGGALDLETFVAKSYELYQGSDPLVLHRAAHGARDILLSLLVR